MPAVTPPCVRPRRWRLRLAGLALGYALLLAGCAPSQAPPPALPPHRLLAGPEALLEVIGALSPRILGVGELHATVDRPGEAAAIDWFTEGLLPLLAPSATDLVIETWVFPGDCGAAEQVVAEHLPGDTRRPPETEDAIARLARRSSELGVTPHALELTCEDYAAVVDAQGEVVYDRLLAVMTRELGEWALQGLATPDARVILYGGAVHNDLHPRAALAAYSYAPAVAAQDPAAYLELDLYPPAAAAAQVGFSEDPWFPLVASATGPGHLVLYERGPHSLIALLPTAAP